MNKRKLEFTDQELNILLFALQKQPFEMVNDLINNLVTQIKAQQQFVQPVETKIEESKVEGVK